MPPDPTPQPVDRDIGYLVDMLENAKIAIRHVRGVGAEQFENDLLLQDAVIRRLGIIGEAARLVSQARRDELAAIPWRQINGMRNILVHDYRGVELKHVWEVIEVHAPELVRIIQQFLDSKGIGPEGETP